MAHLQGKPNKAPGARFSKDPETFRARRQILKSKPVEQLHSF